MRRMALTPHFKPGRDELVMCQPVFIHHRILIGDLQMPPD